MMIEVFVRMEKIVKKGENPGNHHFSFSHNVFKSPFFRLLGFCGKGLMLLKWVSNNDLITNCVNDQGKIWLFLETGLRCILLLGSYSPSFLTMLESEGSLPKCQNFMLILTKGV